MSCGAWLSAVFLLAATRQLQGGKKLREHRFLACLKRKYSDSVMLLVAYVSPIICDAIANASRHAGHQCKVHPAKSEPMPSAAAWWAARRWKLFVTRWRSPTESPRGFQWNWPLCRSQVKHLAPRKRAGCNPNFAPFWPCAGNFHRTWGFFAGLWQNCARGNVTSRSVISVTCGGQGNSKHVIVCLVRRRTPLQICL